MVGSDRGQFEGQVARAVGLPVEIRNGMLTIVRHSVCHVILRSCCVDYKRSSI